MIEIYIDGGSSPEASAIGVVIYRDQKRIAAFGRGLGRRSSIEAEYEALIHALLLAWSAKMDNPTIYSDAEVMVAQVLGKARCKAKRLLPLLDAVLRIRQGYQFRLQAVPRDYVWEADKLAKDVLRELRDEAVQGMRGDEAPQ